MENEKLLQDFSEYCHKHYQGCSEENGKWIYSYDNEIVNYIEGFLKSITETK